jgi:hypothetical protein
MAQDKETLEKVVLSRVIRLNARIHGIVTGVILGAAIFLATNWLILKGGHVGPEGEQVIGPHLSLLGQFFIGYRVTFLGSLIGLAYGLAVGFIGGYFIAGVYNWIIDMRTRKR